MRCASDPANIRGCLNRAIKQKRRQDCRRHIWFDVG
jgi:hypothetical protein